MDDNVFTFVPNIIGYGRILLALLSLWYMPTNHVSASLYYIVSGLLDAVDGYAARFFNQSSRFGAMLDQLTDRCATLALLMTLCVFYPAYTFLFQLSAVLDVASHWLHLHSHDLTGSQSHKQMEDTANPILKLYYTSRAFLFFMCAGNEAFYCMLYLCYFTYGPTSKRNYALATFLRHLIDFFSVPVVGVGAWRLLAALSLPVALAKSAISGVHLLAASRAVVAHDQALRRDARKQQ